MATIATLVAEFQGRDAGFAKMASDVESRLDSMDKGIASVADSTKKSASSLDGLRDSLGGVRAQVKQGAAAFRGLNDVFDVMEGKSQLSVHTFTRLSALLPLMSTPAGALAVGLGAAALAVYRLWEVSEKFIKADFAAELEKIHKAAAVATTGWDAYYKSILAGETMAQAMLAKTAAEASGTFERLHKESEARIADMQKTDDALMSRNDDLRPAIRDLTAIVEAQNHTNAQANTLLKTYTDELAKNEGLLKLHASAIKGERASLIPLAVSTAKVTSATVASSEAFRSAGEALGRGFLPFLKQLDAPMESATMLFNKLAAAASAAAAALGFASGAVSAVGGLQSRLGAMNSKAGGKEDAEAAAGAVVKAANFGAFMSSNMQGSVSGLAGSVMQGAQGGAAAGPLGAAAGAIMVLIENSKTFAKLLESVNGLLQTVADTLGMILEPFVPLFKELADAMAPFLQVLGPILSVLMQLNPLFWMLKLELLVLKPVLKLISDVIKAAAIGILEAIHHLLKAVHAHSKSVDDALDALKHGAQGAADGANAMADSLGSLTNMPAGFKYVLRRFQAMDAQQMGHGGLGGGFGLGQSAAASSATGTGESNIGGSSSIQIGTATIYITNANMHGASSGASGDQSGTNPTLTHESLDHIHREMKRRQNRDLWTRYGAYAPVGR